MSDRNPRRQTRLTKEQINDLTKQLLNLTAQLTQLRIQVAQERNHQRLALAEREEPQAIAIGDLVRIMNNYQNLRGTIGRIIQLNNRFVTIPTNSGREIIRGINNAQRIEDQRQ